MPPFHALPHTVVVLFKANLGSQKLHQESVHTLIPSGKGRIVKGQQGWL